MIRTTATGPDFSNSGQERLESVDIRPEVVCRWTDQQLDRTHTELDTAYHELIEVGRSLDQRCSAMIDTDQKIAEFYLRSALMAVMKTKDEVIDKLGIVEAEQRRRQQERWRGGLTNTVAGILKDVDLDQQEKILAEALERVRQRQIQEDEEIARKLMEEDP